MSRMSDLHLEIQELVVDAVSTPGIISELDILDYVNERSPIDVDCKTIEAIMDHLFGEDDWAGGCDLPVYYPEGVIIQ